MYHDFTKRAWYEQQPNALHETTRKLMAATSHETIASLGSEAASEILDLPLNGIHLYDDATHELAPVAVSGTTRDIVGEPPSIPAGEGIAWEVFDTGETRIYDDVRTADAVFNPDTPIRSELYLPLGSHGVFLLGSTTAADFDDTDVALANVLAANIEAALDRAAREQELRDREAQLGHERDRFATLFEYIPDPAVIVALRDGEPITRAVNQAFEAVFGYSEQDVLGTSLNELIVPTEAMADAEAIDERALAGEQLVQEVRRQTADGDVRDFLFRNVPIEADTAQAYGIYTDITDRKRRERDLRRKNEQLEEFANIISHDLALLNARQRRDRVNFPQSHSVRDEFLNSEDAVAATHGVC
ncbi:PAS domain S-box protein [Haloarcula sp. JP-L23]|uniref:PAS domain S-box protein n=1 Tax=Haloarcula sp. JP-L23 TaxID=2716717 RepID=UPI00140EC016|nr:PAS domain S-box protein [Haloarcula sp. JP-L23]